MIKIVRFSFDAALLTTFLSAVKNKSGIEIRTDGITDETAKKAVDLYLAAGDRIVDMAAQQFNKYPQFFKNSGKKE